MMRVDGCAVLVDLEKCRYSYAQPDLAHATRYTSTTWDAASSAAHVRGRVDHCLSTAIVEQVLGEIDALAQTRPNTDDQDNVIIEPDRP